MSHPNFCEPNKLMSIRTLKDNLGWAENLTIQDLTIALMQALTIMDDMQDQISDLRNELDEYHECYPLPDTGKEPTVGDESV